MEIQFCGANCLVITTKHLRLVVDDSLAELGAKSVSRDEDVALFTGPYSLRTKAPKLLIDQPGEYEVSGVSIYGLAARGYANGPDEPQNVTMYKVVTDGINLLIVGHVYPDLTDAQLEVIGEVDVMTVPVGDHGYTLDGVGALKIIKKVEPKLVVPTHYQDDGLTFPVPQQPLDEAVKMLAMEPKETTAKLRVKPSELGDTTQLIVLERS